MPKMGFFNYILLSLLSSLFLIEGICVYASWRFLVWGLRDGYNLHTYLIVSIHLKMTFKKYISPLNYQMLCILSEVAVKLFNFWNVQVLPSLVQVQLEVYRSRSIYKYRDISIKKRFYNARSRYVFSNFMLAPFLNRLLLILRESTVLLICNKYYSLYKPIFNKLLTFFITGELQNATLIIKQIHCWYLHQVCMDKPATQTY